MYVTVCPGTTWTPMPVTCDFAYAIDAYECIMADQSAVTSVRGPTAPKCPCLLATEFSLFDGGA